ncbi:MAG: quinone-dependent dihydroorotate dehydrogenase [Raineya sp.]|nr:quinone-dependent dihydroorotate dehydrogenase [Raineya sp.]MDW8296488.1 quinone-dependent dihydroorotate dehydrogenase [Raineya sp.]
MFYKIIRFFLFLLPAEKAHHFTFALLKVIFRSNFLKTIFCKIYHYENPALARQVAGLYFSNPVGLAAGFDKNAVAIDELATFGFGFIEIGTLTPKPQSGNPQPRLFRLRKDKAIINRMGFNNDGILQAIENLKKRKSDIIVGGNIGKNKDTPNEKALEDYLFCFEQLFDFVDYFVVNVSSPNTPNLRALQEKEPLKQILLTLQTENQKKERAKPIFLKIAPDLTPSQLDDIVEIVLEAQIAGVIATNTTIARENLKSRSSLCSEAGGLSGKPLRERATQVIAYLAQKAQKRFAIIGVGGIFSPHDAFEKLQAGADLVQIYTGLIYEGPSLIKRIKKFLVKKLTN